MFVRLKRILEDRFYDYYAFISRFKSNKTLEESAMLILASLVVGNLGTIFLALQIFLGHFDFLQRSNRSMHLAIGMGICIVVAFILRSILVSRDKWRGIVKEHEQDKAEKIRHSRLIGALYFFVTWLLFFSVAVLLGIRLSIPFF